MAGMSASLRIHQIEVCKPEDCPGVVNHGSGIIIPPGVITCIRMHQLLVPESCAGIVVHAVFVGVVTILVRIHCIYIERRTIGNHRRIFITVKGNGCVKARFTVGAEIDDIFLRSLKTGPSEPVTFTREGRIVRRTLSVLGKEGLHSLKSRTYHAPTTCRLAVFADKHIMRIRSPGAYLIIEPKTAPHDFPIALIGSCDGNVTHQHSAFCYLFPGGLITYRHLRESNAL